eukprot:160386-Pyramimonas_sp.AAC.1
MSRVPMPAGGVVSCSRRRWCNHGCRRSPLTYFAALLVPSMGVLELLLCSEPLVGTLFPPIP